MTNGLLTRLIALPLLTVSIAAAHHYAPVNSGLLVGMLRYLYFLPIVLACVWFGWRGGIATAVLAAVAYLPGTVLHGEEIGEVLDFLLVGSIAGVLAEKELEQRRSLQRASTELQRTYEELQTSFDQLRQAERLSAIGQLSSSLAHEIRNPLASIEGAADVLRGGKLDEQTQAEFLDIIRRECRRLSGMLTGLLDFSRTRAPAVRDVMLESIVQPVAELARLAAARLPVTIRTAIDPELCSLRCDPDQLKQVLLNLAVNAVQAMPDGGTLEIAARKEGSQVVIEVLDEGSGIAPEHAERLFTPFFTTKPNGTGLGLSVAQQIVHRHGGHISVRPRSSRGTVFAVVLPLAEVGREVSV